MFETAELGRELSREEYEERRSALRTSLVQRQHDLRQTRHPVLVVIDGDDRLGCFELMSVLHEWMDPRFLVTTAFAASTEREQRFPDFWRYWMALPPAGRIGVIVRGWNMRTIVRSVTGELDAAEVERELEHIRAFERVLVDDGVHLVKLWLHLPHKALKKRVKAARHDPAEAWKVRDVDEEFVDNHHEVREISEHLLQRTSTGDALWHVIESGDWRYRDVAACTIVDEVLERASVVGARLTGSLAAVPSTVTSVDPVTILDTVDLSASLGRSKYERELEHWQAEIAVTMREAQEREIPVVLAFEGWDAAGKGGAIRRMVHSLDASRYRIVPIAAPTDEERAYPYLWRFWRQLPEDGRMVVFDRSWYGRVLVERVEGFASEADWRRAYSEIVDFEAQLVEHGAVLVKCWLHIDADEQLRRFEKRAETPWKQHKITDEDWRNREKWSAYEAAANEMIERTSTAHAPWHLVAANDKKHARVEVIRTVTKAVKARL